MLHMAKPEFFVEALGLGCCGKKGKQVAYLDGVKSNDLSCHYCRACCWLEAIAFVSSWTGGLQTREPQLALAANSLKLMRELELDRFQEERLSRLSEGSGLI